MRVICHGNVKKCVVFTSCVRLFAIPWAIAHQNPLPMGFPRQEYWSDLPSPPPQMWIHKLAIISRETMRELQLLFITMALIQFWMKVYIHSFLIMTVLNSRPPHPPNSCYTYFEFISWTSRHEKLGLYNPGIYLLLGLKKRPLSVWAAGRAWSSSSTISPRTQFIFNWFSWSQDDCQQLLGVVLLCSRL